MADVIDNSISASATSVVIRLDVASGIPVVNFIDNGNGMDQGELLDAMRHGGQGILKQRSSNDLGRYGLGLKTASLSQCRRLTVISQKANGSMVSAQWDLSEVEQRDEWVLLLPTASDLSKYKSANELGQLRHGTVVIWEDFDLALSGSTQPVKALESLLDDARTHLSLTFHRFLKGGDVRSPLDININGLSLSGIDPFLASNGKTQELPTEEVRIAGSRVRITPFILPQLKNISSTELTALGGAAGLRYGQGFYVYRNKRLIIAGTWFRMLRVDELTKLARVRIDIPNTMDSLWNLDVKKSTATPPEPVKRVLKRIIDRIANRSLDSFRDRGTRGKAKPYTPVWTRNANGKGVSYSINRDHPMVAELIDDGLRSKTSAGERTLKLIEMSFPYAAITADINGEAQLGLSAAIIERDLRKVLAEWIERCAGDTEMIKDILNALPSLDPFATYPEITKALTEAYA